MKAKRLSRFLGLISGAFLVALSPAAGANFFVDYHGVERKKASAHELTEAVHEIGKGLASSTSSFGADMPLKDAVALLMPNRWIAYIDQNVKEPVAVEWQAKNQPWTDILAQMGAKFGYRFIVDWDQKLLQISLQKGFKSPDYNDPIAIREPETGKTIFVYSTKPLTESGVFIVNGKNSRVEITAKKAPIKRVSSGQLSDQVFESLLEEMYQSDDHKGD